MNLHNKLKQNIIALYPSVKEILINKHIARYIDVVCRELVDRITFYNVEDGTFSLREDNMREECGRITVGERKEWLYTWLARSPKTRLINVVNKGRPGQYTTANINGEYMEELMAEITAKDLDTDKLNDIYAKGFIRIDVDTESFAAFIDALCQPNPNKIRNPVAYERKLTLNRLICNQIHQYIKEDADGFYINEYWEESDTGRVYGHGLSLQRIPKEVRHALLGHCHKYDFKACVYALMTGEAERICKENGIKAEFKIMRDYIKNRADIRKRIAADIGVHESKVKEIFTAIGFGARISNTGHTSIQLSKDKIEKLQKNTEFKAIYKEFKDVMKIVDFAYPNLQFELCGKQYNYINKDGTKKNKQQKLSWIYQCLESKALSLFTELISTYIPEMKVLLTAHDCVYTKQSIPAGKFTDLHFYLQQKYPLLTFEHCEVWPIATKQYIATKVNEVDSQIAQQKAFIAEQEVMAKQYNVSNVPEKKKQTMSPFVMIHADLYETNEEEYFKDSY